MEHQALLQTLLAYHEAFPEQDATRRQELLGIAIIGPDGAVRASGTSVIEVADDGSTTRRAR